MRTLPPFTSPSAAKAKVFMFSLIAAFSLTVLSAANAADKKCEYTREDDNKSVTLELYDVTSLRLPVQMGTGYSWKVSALPDVLEQEAMTVKGGGAPGASGVQIFRFRSTKKGQGKLVLENVRPWEQPEKPQDTFTLTIVVE